MFDLELKASVKAHATEQVERYNFGQRKYALNGSNAEQLTGIIGQCIIQDALGMELVDGSTGFDGGQDLETVKRIDVKTTGRTTKARADYSHQFVGCQINVGAEIYLFCSFNKRKEVLTVCGWLTRQELIMRAVFNPKGSEITRADGTTFNLKYHSYEVKYHQLNQVENLAELFWIVNQ